MEITVSVKNVYGVERIYPVCEKAYIFAEIARTKTFDRLVIERIKELGYTVNVQQVAI